MLNLFSVVIYLRISLSLTLPPDFRLWAYPCRVLLYLVSSELELISVTLRRMSFLV